VNFKQTSVIAGLLTVFLVGQAFSPLEAEGKAKKGKAKAAKQLPPYPPEFNDAVKLVVYDKKYKEAFEIFDRLDRNGFCRDKTHYYMGLCKHNMNQLQEAAQHYQVVYNFSKDQQLKYLAAVGYGQVAKYAKNRTYSGQGNLFARMSTGASNAAGPWSGSGGGAADCGPRG
jgi:tetratricopeptide (TPR) repeat protein